MIKLTPTLLFCWLFLIFGNLNAKTNPNTFYLAKAKEVDSLTKIGKYQAAAAITDSIITFLKLHSAEAIPLDWQLRRAHLDFELENYHQAKTVLTDILNQAETLNETQYIQALVLQTKVFTQFGLYEESDVLAKQAFELVDTSAYSSESIKVLNAFAYNQLFHDALTIYYQSKSLQEMAGVKDSITYLETLVAIAWIHDYYQQNEEVENLIQICQSLNIQKNIFYAEWLEFFGYYLNIKERYRESIEALTIVDKMYTESYGKNHRFTIENINNLAVRFIHLQDYFNAEKNYSRALAIQKSFGENRREYGEVLYNFADLYLSTGRYKKGIEFVKKAIEIFEKVPKNPNTEKDFYGLAHLKAGQTYASLGDLELSENYLTQADSIFRVSKKWEHIIRVKNFRGKNFQRKNNFAAAKDIFLEGLDLVKEKEGGNRNLIALCNNLSVNYFQQQNFYQALIFAEQGKKLSQKIYGNQSFDYTIFLNLLGKIHEARSDLVKAKYYFELSNANTILQLENYYPALNEQEKVLFLKKAEGLVATSYQFAQKHYEEMPSLVEEVQNLSLSIKGLGLESSRQFLREEQNKHTELIYRKWLEARKKLRNAFDLSSKAKAEKGINISTLQEQISSLEKQLGWESKQVDIEKFTAKDIQSRLKKGEVVIDFIRFKATNKQFDALDTIHYVAVLNQYGAKFPKMIPIGNEFGLSKLLGTSIKETTRNYITDADLNKQLYDLVWTPIQPYLAGVNKVHLCPDGFLHQLSFGALKANNKTLTEQFELVYHTSLRDFVQKNKISTTNKKIVLLGGADFDYNLKLAFSEKQKTTVAYQNKSNRKRAMNPNALYFSYLPGSKIEVENIATQFQAKKWNVNLFIDQFAREEMIKSFTGENAPQILHIATHGFFFKQLGKRTIETKNLRENLLLAENPLFRSGLVFTGANQSWHSGQPIDGMENGILTAFEIYNLNLSKTELVVLSACDTGKGDILDGEGVFGLQRAFKMAGVDKLLLSLWKVPDQATALLMQTFYQKRLAGMSIEKAFTAAQRTLIKDHPEWSAYHWGAFILLD